MLTPDLYLGADEPPDIRLLTSVGDVNETRMPIIATSHCRVPKSAGAESDFEHFRSS